MEAFRAVHTRCGPQKTPSADDACAGVRANPAPFYSEALASRYAAAYQLLVGIPIGDLLRASRRARATSLISWQLWES